MDYRLSPWILARSGSAQATSCNWPCRDRIVNYLESLFNYPLLEKPLAASRNQKPPMMV